MIENLFNIYIINDDYNLVYLFYLKSILFNKKFNNFNNYFLYLKLDYNIKFTFI